LSLHANRQVARSKFSSARSWTYPVALFTSDKHTCPKLWSIHWNTKLLQVWHRSGTFDRLFHCGACMCLTSRTGERMEFDRFDRFLLYILDLILINMYLRSIYAQVRAYKLDRGSDVSLARHTVLYAA
jgi:hypothetical protein